MKCLPQAKIVNAQGVVLHDWHAEVLAIRAFNRFLVDECRKLVIAAKDNGNNGNESTREKEEATAVVWRLPRHTKEQESIQQHDEPGKRTWQNQSFALAPNISIHMYCSEAPCGDASMELIMQEQEDATPWKIPAIPQVHATSSTGETLSLLQQNLQPIPLLQPSLAGRAHFSRLGTVRRKPSRPDAPPTLSKSCSDKLALRQFTSLLSSLTSLLIYPENVYLSSLILPDSQLVQAACARCFEAEGRLKHVVGVELGGGYRFRPLHARATRREFTYSRRGLRSLDTKGTAETQATDHAMFIPSNISVVYTPSVQETLINGVLQGRKQSDERGASAVCRKMMWKAVDEVIGLLGMQINNAEVPGHQFVHEDVLAIKTYKDMKECQTLRERRRAKDLVQEQGLVGWVKNVGDDGFSIKLARPSKNGNST
jgi:tRNA-specific adenosine deaminase 1